jgi:hypothetical protein
MLMLFHKQAVAKVDPKKAFNDRFVKKVAGR